MENRDKPLGQLYGEIGIDCLYMLILGWSPNRIAHLITRMGYTTEIQHAILDYAVEMHKKINERKNQV